MLLEHTISETGYMPQPGRRPRQDLQTARRGLRARLREHLAVPGVRLLRLAETAAGRHPAL